MNQEKIGKFIAKLRKENNLTQEELAEKIRVSDKTISKWERGINIPDTTLLCELSRVFNVTVQDILNGEVNEDKKRSNKVLINSINLGKKQLIKRIFLCILIIILVLISIFSIIYTITNFNRNRVFSIKSKNDMYLVDGYVVFNQNQEILVIQNIDFNDITIGTELEPIIKEYSIRVQSGDSTFFIGRDNSLISTAKISQALKSARVNFNSQFYNDELITYEDLKDMYILLSYVDINDVTTDVKIDLDMTEEFANNKLFY